MFEKFKGRLVVICDTCLKELKLDTEDFDDAKLMTEADGWYAYKVGTEWKHMCDACDEKEVLW